MHNYMCDPIEVTVITDHGNQTVTWSEFIQDGVSVSKEPLHYPYSFHLAVTSHEDNLAVKNVVVNRGNCHFSDGEHLPQALKFGDRYVRLVFCNPLEVQIATDQGQATFTWDR